MESAGGEDLSWFWRGWYMNNWTLDMAVTNLAQDSDLAKGAKVTVENRGQLVLPATLRVIFKDGGHRDLRVPVETWMQSGSHVFAIDTPSPVAEVVIDPDHRLPDRDRSNNSLRSASGG
jgi:hypothetical protein